MKDKESDTNFDESIKDVWTDTGSEVQGIVHFIFECNNHVDVLVVYVCEINFTLETLSGDMLY